MNNLKFRGYGFNPSDQLLIEYLRDRTLLGRDYLVQDIIDLGHDICNYDPWDLPGCDSVRFFVYPKTYKYPNSNPKVVDSSTSAGPDGTREPMINRTTNNGKWKVSGDRIKLKASDSNEVNGIKTRLYFKKNGCLNKTSSCVLYQFELTDVDPSRNKYFLGKLMMKEFKTTDVGSTQLETSNRISMPEVQVEFDPEPLVEIEAPSDYEWIQNQTSEQTTEFITSVPVNGSFVNDGNDVISSVQPSNEFADYATPQIDYLELIRSWLEVPDVGDQNHLNINQHDQSIPYIRIDNDQKIPEERSNQHNTLAAAAAGTESFPNVRTDTDQTNTEERSNQHNIVAVADDGSLNLPTNLHNYLSQINWSVFDDLCWNDGLCVHELFDGAQNQCGTDQQVADARDKSTADAEIEGYNNLPFLGVTEYSESVRKRLVMELEISNNGIGTELAQPQPKKSRL